MTAPRARSPRLLATERRIPIALIALAGLCLPGEGAAQSGVELGVGVARAGKPTASLSDDGCAADNAWAAEAHGGLRLSRSVRLVATTGYHLEEKVRCAADPPPVPPSGPFERSFVTVPEAGYPFFTTDARLAFEPSSPAGPVWLRAFGGYGRMWGKGIGYWLAGGGLVFGTRLQSLIDLEWMWFDVPFETIERSFQDGVLVTETSTPGESSERTFRLRLALRWRL